MSQTLPDTWTFLLQESTRCVRIFPWWSWVFTSCSWEITCAIHVTLVCPMCVCIDAIATWQRMKNTCLWPSSTYFYLLIFTDILTPHAFDIPTLKNSLLQSLTSFNLGVGCITIFIHFKGIKTSKQYLEAPEQLAEHFIHPFARTRNDHLWRWLEGAGPVPLPGFVRRWLMSIANQDACCNVRKNVIWFAFVNKICGNILCLNKYPCRVAHAL